MKIKKQDFYAAIKEVMVEMIMTGEMTQVLAEANHMAAQRGYRGQQPMQPMQQMRGRAPSKFSNTARRVASVIGKGDPKQTSVMEQVFSELEDNAIAQQNSEFLPQNFGEEEYGQYDQYDAYDNGNGYGQYQQQQPAYRNDYNNQQMAPVPNGRNGFSSRAEELAFGTPIKNRPSNEAAALGGYGGGGSGNYLPGITKNYNG